MADNTKFIIAIILVAAVMLLFGTGSFYNEQYSYDDYVESWLGAIDYNHKPADMSPFEFEQKVIEANQPSGALQLFAVSCSGSFKKCSVRYTSCNPCSSGQSASNCYADLGTGWSYCYCETCTSSGGGGGGGGNNDPPPVTCSGGQSPGAKKCSGGDVFKCSSGGDWNFYQECEFGCSSGNCYGDCNSASQCGGEGPTGATFCGSDGKVYQKYNTPSCNDHQCGSSTEDRVVQTCAAREYCSAGACVKEEELVYYEFKDNQCLTINGYASEKQDNWFTDYEVCTELIIDDSNLNIACPAVCVPVYQLAGDVCLLNECGSGCGPDNNRTFATQEECESKLPVEGFFSKYGISLNIGLVLGITALVVFLLFFRRRNG